MRRVVLAALAMAALGLSGRAQAQDQSRPTADVYIRSQAGLPPSTARGEIEVLDIGHNPTDTMLSIVGHRTASGWKVSYVCAQSPRCDPKHFVLSKDFDLSADAAGRLDAMLARVEAEPEDSPPPSGSLAACGRLAVNIDDRGVKRRYRRACTWSKDLSELEILMKAGLP